MSVSLQDIADSVLQCINEARSAREIPELLLSDDVPEGEEEYDYNIELPTVSLGSTALDVPEGGSLDDAVRAELTTVLEEGNEDYAELYSRSANYFSMASENEDNTAIKIKLIHKYIQLEPIGPVIDNRLVLQGSCISNDYGPALCRVQCAADHEEEFSEVAVVHPWDMIFHRAEPGDEGEEERKHTFIVPIALPPGVDGTIRLVLFVDHVSRIPYGQQSDEFMEAAHDDLIPAVSYSRRVSATTDGSGDGDKHVMRFVVGNICTVRSAEEREERETEGFEVSAVDIGEQGPTTTDASSWPFCIATMLTVKPEEQHEELVGVEDVIFAVAETQGSPPELPEGYDVLTEITHSDDVFPTVIAVKMGSARFSKILMFSCSEENASTAEHLIEDACETLGGGEVRMAPSGTCQTFGARVGFLLLTGDAQKLGAADPEFGDVLNDVEERGLRTHSRDNSAGGSEDGASRSTRRSKAERGAEEGDAFPATQDAAAAAEDEEVMKPSDLARYDDERSRHSLDSAAFTELSEENQDDDDRNEEEIQDLLREKAELEVELSKARAINAETQRRTAMLIARLGKDQSQSNRNEDENANTADAIAEKERHYKETMELISECDKRLKKEQGEYEQQALDLQTRLDDKEFKAEEIAASLRQFKREILMKAENSRTGKGVSQRMIKQFEQAEAKKDEDLEKVRLRNISLRTTIRKMEKLLRSKEQLAEGLHMIDFEQLKIENQTLNEKIEERNEELGKLKRKKTFTVQVLTHIREKTRFVEKTNESMREKLAGLEREIIDFTAQSGMLKQERDGLKVTNLDLKGQRGFATSDLLIVDYEQRKTHMDNLKASLNHLQERHMVLTSMIKKDEITLTTFQPQTPALPPSRKRF